MKMKKYVLITLLIGWLTGCSDFTEIDPKGKNILNRVEDLDLVLNAHYDVSCEDVAFMMNDIFPQFVNVPNLLTEKIKTLNGVFATWDETADRAALTATDDKYSNLYAIIGKVANAVLLNIDGATGNRAKADQLKAEALLLRAWCHYILVNLYAEAYDPATAATDPGIVYILETDELAVPDDKKTVAEVYEAILKDLDAAFALNSLPENPAKMRVGLAFAYAAKAKILMSMRDYDGAFEAAEASLKLKNTIDDYNDKLALSEMNKAQYGIEVYEFSRYYLTFEEELWETPSWWGTMPFTYEFWDELEANHIYHTALLTDTYLATQTPLIQPNQALEYNGLENLPFPTVNDVYYSSIGLTTVDMYLVQAEYYIRDGETKKAMEIINGIREKRLLAGTYSEVSAETPEKAFDWLKKVSRVENFYTFKNFINLKRWNTEEKYAETLHREITYTQVTERDETGKPVKTETITCTYELSPDSPLWIFAFPQDVTALNPYLTQNY